MKSAGYRTRNSPPSARPLEQRFQRFASIWPRTPETAWVVVHEGKHKGQRWEVVVNPDSTTECLGVITAYPVERRFKKQ